MTTVRVKSPVHTGHPPRVTTRLPCPMRPQEPREEGNVVTETGHWALSAQHREFIRRGNSTQEQVDSKPTPSKFSQIALPRGAPQYCTHILKSLLRDYN